MSRPPLHTLVINDSSNQARENHGHKPTHKLNDKHIICRSTGHCYAQEEPARDCNDQHVLSRQVSPNDNHWDTYDYIGKHGDECD